MHRTTIDSSQITHIAANKTIEELELLYRVMSETQRDLLISLLNEERETLEPHTEQNMWASERVAVIDSILNRLTNY